MSLVIVNEPIPLEKDTDGVIHIGGTRVTLDTVVAAFNLLARQAKQKR